MGHKGQAQKDHEAARGQRPQKLEDLPPEEQQRVIREQVAMMPPGRLIQHVQFFILDPQPTPGGGALLEIVLPTNGDRLQFSISPERRKEIGELLLAPSLDVAGPGDVERARAEAESNGDLGIGA